ncbi:MAG: cytidylate kinase-like family protein [Verrucomicrobiota bacterium]|nr:cytidylate kinase-like family protein [Verrucomicrobiota bacterium]
MIAQPSIERCKAFIDCQLQPARERLAAAKSGERWRAVTISRQAGSGAHAMAEELAYYMQTSRPKETPPWTVFDRDLVKKVIEEHHLPERMARFLAEDRISELQDTVDELFGLHPQSWTLVRQTVETILHLVELGRVIIIGRGAGIATRNLDYVFHVRLVGSLERRLQYVQESCKLGEKEAVKFIHQEDRGRRRYLKKYFNLEIDDPLLYHVVINTDRVPPKLAARMIGEALLDHT